MKKRIFTLLFIAVFASTVGLGIIEPLMAIYAESLGATGLLIGLIFSSFTIARAISTPIVGKLSDHNGRKRFIIGGLVMYTLSSFLYLWADSVQSLIIVRLLQGSTSAFVVPIAFAYIGDLAPKGREGEYLGTFTMSMFFGLAIGPVIGGVLNHLYSIDIAFIAMGLLGLFSLLLVGPLLPELKLHKKTKPARLREIIKDKKMQLILLMRFATSFGVAGFLVFIPLYATNLGLNTAQIGTLVTLNLLVSTLPQRYFGKVADRVNKFKMIALGNIILGTTIFLIPFTWNFTSLLVVNAVMGLGGALAIPANSALAAQFGRIHGMGSAMGLLQTSFAVGMSVGPLIAGLILDFAGLNMVFVFTSTVVVGGSILFYVVTRRNNHKVESIS